MLSKTLLTAYLAILVEARFGQEQVPIQAISEVQGGQPGQAQTIAGAAISDLLAAANPCDKLQRGDQILAELGTGADAMAAAIGMVAAEQNFNPFNTDKPTICSDPTLPTSAALRGITPLVDPDVDGADVANALSNQTRANPLDATGLSVADLLQQNGFTNFATKDSNGNAGAAGDANAGNANANANANAGSASASSTAAAATAAADVSSSSTSCNNNADQQQQQQQQQSNNSNSSSASSANSNSSTAAAASSAGSGQTASSKNLDFGKCTPTMEFVGGLNGRPADEFTFQAIDPLVAKGQQEALNPNIITNRICDQLTNVCDAADDAKAACLDAKAQIEALGTRDQSTADAWNEALGFAGATASARKMMVRGMRRGVRGGVRREVMDWAKVRA